MTIKNDKQDAEAKAKADAEAKALADAKAKEDAGNQDQDDNEGNDGDDDDQDGSSTTIDYKSELEKERAKRLEAEKLIAEKKFKAKHRKEEEEDEEDDDEDDDKPLTRKEFNRRLESEREKLRKEANEERVLEIAKEMAESDDEAEYIAEVYKNRSFPSHLSMREQIEECYAIVNRKKLISKNSELARALKSKSTVSKDVTDTYRDQQKGSAPKIPAQDEAAYKRAGFVYNATDKVYEKTLPNKKKLIKDPRTKQTWIK